MKIFLLKLILFFFQIQRKFSLEFKSKGSLVFSKQVMHYNQLENFSGEILNLYNPKECDRGLSYNKTITNKIFNKQ